MGARASFFVVAFLLSLDFALAVISDFPIDIPDVGCTPPDSNYGEVCGSNENCTLGLCLKCPNDTETVIRTPSHCYYEELTNDTYRFNLLSNQSYCAYDMSGTKCLGEIDGDEYEVVLKTYYTSMSDPYRGEYADFYLSSIEEFTQEAIMKWKNLIVNVSEDYFEQHFDIIDIKPQIRNEYLYERGEENLTLTMYLRYKFSFDWVETGATWENVDIKEFYDDGWIWLSDERILGRYQEDNKYSGKIRPTDVEIESVMSEGDAISKMKECNENLDIESISVVTSQSDFGDDIFTTEMNGTFKLVAFGHITTGYSGCNEGTASSLSSYTGTVDLVSGLSYCEVSHSACPGRPSLEEQSLIYTLIGLLVILILIVLVVIKIKIF